MVVQALKRQAQTRSTENLTNGFFNLFGGTTTKSGTPVSNYSALSLAAFYNGINILANDVAKLPKAVYYKQDRNSVKHTSHPLHNLIAKQPNEYMTSFMFHSVLTIDAILKGNGYAEIKRSSYNASLDSLEYINQDKTPVQVKIYDSKLWYLFDGRVVPAENMIHIPGFSFNGITGIGVVAHAAKSLGTALSSQEFAEEYYKTKGIGTGVVTSTKFMDNDAKTRYSNALSNTLSNANPFKVAVVDEAGSFQHIKLTPQESLFLETNKHAVEEIARWLNLPLYKLKITENQNNSNMEHQSMSHVVDGILPWKLKFEQEYYRKCFTKAEKNANHYVKFNEKILLIADQESQSKYYATMFNIMGMIPAEIRDLNDMDYIEGLDQPFLPVNIQSLEQLKINTELKKKELNTQTNE